MGYAENIRLLFIVITMIVIGTVSIVRVGAIDLHAILTTAAILVPAIVVMGYLGQKIGEIVDNPKNRADADYKIAVLNALKKMDKSITLQELNEKLTKQVAEPDLPEPPEDDNDVLFFDYGKINLVLVGGVNERSIFSTGNRKKMAGNLGKG